MYRKLSKDFMLNFVDSFCKEFSVQISQFVDTFRVFPAISVNTGNFDVAKESFWLDYGELRFSLSFGCTFCNEINSVHVVNITILV